jgi:hypothetical protein
VFRVGASIDQQLLRGLADQSRYRRPPTGCWKSSTFTSLAMVAAPAAEEL